MTPPHLTQELADEYAVGGMDPAAASAISRHIEECESCRVMLAESQELASSLAFSVGIRPPPLPLRERVLGRVGILQHGRARRIVRLATAGAGVAAVIVAIAALVGFVSLRSQVSDLRAQNDALSSKLDDVQSQKVQIAALSQRLSEQEQTASTLSEDARSDQDLLLALMSPQSDVATLYATNDSTSAVGRLVWDAQQKRVWFVAVNLAPLPSNELYELWVESNGHYVSLGAFASDSTGFARYETWVPEGLQGYDSVVVTIERLTSDDNSPGPSVFAANLTQLKH
jgi:anti-sigma-K factor RskA